MTTEAYELVVRMPHGTSPGGASVRYLTTVNGREFESDPQPLADATDPVFVAFAEQFSAKTVAERDAAVAERDAAVAERDAAQTALTTVTAERDAARAEVERLTAELDAIRNPTDSQGFPVLSAVQLRLGILAAGLTLEGIDAAIAGIEDPTQRVRVQTYWEFATQFERSHPLVAGMVGLLGMTEQQADELWRAAGGIQ